MAAPLIFHPITSVAKRLWAKGAEKLGFAQITRGKGASISVQLSSRAGATSGTKFVIAEVLHEVEVHQGAVVQRVRNLK